MVPTPKELQPKNRRHAPQRDPDMRNSVAAALAAAAAGAEISELVLLKKILARLEEPTPLETLDFRIEQRIEEAMSKFDDAVSDLRSQVQDLISAANDAVQKLQQAQSAQQAAQVPPEPSDEQVQAVTSIGDDVKGAIQRLRDATSQSGGTTITSPQSSDNTGVAGGTPGASPTPMPGGPSLSDVSTGPGLSPAPTPAEQPQPGDQSASSGNTVGPDAFKAGA